jgi:hypothetical protein
MYIRGPFFSRTIARERLKSTPMEKTFLSD